MPPKPAPKRQPELGKPSNNKSNFKYVPTKRGLLDNGFAGRNGGLHVMRERLNLLREYLSDPTKQTSAPIRAFVKSAVTQYELAVKASIGMPTYSDSVTTQVEASKDIPTVPLSGFQLVQRTCQVVKSATSGTTAGGFFATLSSADLLSFVSPSSKFYRIKKVTSWTVPRADGNLAQGTFAGVAVPQSSAGGSAVSPIWSENWTPVGQGFAGIVTRYPLGDFPQYDAGGTSTNILNHFTSLGNTGGITGVPVVMHVEIECLI